MTMMRGSTKNKNKEEEIETKAQILINNKVKKARVSSDEIKNTQVKLTFSSVNTDS